jgi:hypothetical protein
MYAFIHMPKTGGSTLRHVLRCAFGVNHCDIKVPPKRRRDQAWIAPQDLRIARRYYPRLEGICGHRVTCFNGLEEAAPDIRYFTFMREPVSRFVSNYRHHLRDTGAPDTVETLRAFASEPGRRNVMSRMLCGREDGDAAIEMLEGKRVFVGLTREFDVSFVLLADWLGRRDLVSGYCTLNQGSNGNGKTIESTPEQAVIVEEANREDLKVYAYVVERVFPRQRDTYRGKLEADVEALRRSNAKGVELRESAWAKIKRSWLYKPGIHLM